MQVMNCRIEGIFPYEKNPRKNEHAVQKTASSIQLYGFRQPIVVDKDYVIIAGHTRYKAAISLGLEEVPIHIADDLDPELVKAYRIADNRIGDESDWDRDILKLELEDLKDLDLELEITGFDTDELDELFAKEKKGLTGDDDIPSKPENITTNLGDIWCLGQHRIMCGDSTNKNDIERLMNGKKADLSFTSPPYNVGANIGYENKDSKYKNSDDNLDDYDDLIMKSTQLSLDYAIDVFVNLQILANNKKDIINWMQSLVDNFKDIFFWKKSQVASALAKNVANTQTELILLFGKKNTSRAWGNKRFRGDFSNTIETKSASGENKNTEIHNATFPVDLVYKFIEHGYIQESTVLDLFVGTGTTIIACEKRGAVCYGMEIEPEYVDIAVKRWEEFTGKEAKRV